MMSADLEPHDDDGKSKYNHSGFSMPSRKTVGAVLVTLLFVGSFWVYAEKQSLAEERERLKSQVDLPSPRYSLTPRLLYTIVKERRPLLA